MLVESGFPSIAERPQAATIYWSDHMKNGKYWAVTAAFTVVLGVALFTAEFDALGNGILFAGYGLASGLTYRFLHTKARPPATKG